ncbi:uncharacterized protein [Primulina eburnea]|uniref:uncharacterized protein n=1 Tax=Primulina eburnea TaxID=1245227 RepID=UPI003C6CC4E3
MIRLGLSQLVCGGCRTVLLYPRGATNVRCTLCNMVTPVPPTATAPMPNHVAHVNCGNCCITLMYPAGAPSVKCSICHYILNVNMDYTRSSLQMHQTVGNSLPASKPSTSSATVPSQNQTESHDS